MMMSSLEKFAPCEGRGRVSVSRIPKAVFGARSDRTSCQQSLDPFDASAWVEAPLVSYKERGLQKMVLGCANLVPDAADCLYSGQTGHAATMELNFDFAKFPATARVRRAILAVYVENNSPFFTDQARFRGRLNIGDAYASLGASRTDPADRTRGGRPEGWVTVDITDFAARAINEQRPSVSFEVSMACGRSEQELTTVRLLRSLPVVVVEYR
jgi:hypothetical protein